MVPQPNRAGTVYGPSHKAGGVKFVLDTGHVIEEEGKEVNIPQELLSSKTVYTFRGSNKNILHRILKLAGLSAFDKVTDVRYGDVIICMRSAEDKTIRTVKGTIAELLDQVNQSNGCKPILNPKFQILNSKLIAKDGMRIPLKQKIKDWQIKDPNSPRWQKKKEHLLQLSNVIHKLRAKVSRDLNNYMEGQDGSERNGLLALVITIIDNTGERVGNNKSADKGHFGVTGFEKNHIQVIGNKIHLDYIGKKGVPHKTSFNNERIARAIKKAMKNTPKTLDGKKNECIFISSDGVCINDDKANDYLKEFGITTKVLRGYFSNSMLIKKLSALPIDSDTKKRKKVFNASAKTVALLTGHTPHTMRTHYMIPELPVEYIDNGRIIDMKNLGYYNDGGIAGQKIKSNFVNMKKPITTNEIIIFDFPDTNLLDVKIGDTIIYESWKRKPLNGKPSVYVWWGERLGTVTKVNKDKSFSAEMKSMSGKRKFNYNFSVDELSTPIKDDNFAYILGILPNKNEQGGIAGDDFPTDTQKEVNSGKVTYRGLGFGKEGVKIKVHGKEYVISNEKFEELGGIKKIKFNAPFRKFDEGGIAGKEESCGCFHSYLLENCPELCENLMEEDINSNPEMREEMDEAHEKYQALNFNS